MQCNASGLVQCSANAFASNRFCSLSLAHACFWLELCDRSISALIKHRSVAQPRREGLNASVFFLFFFFWFFVYMFRVFSALCDAFFFFSFLFGFLSPCFGFLKLFFWCRFF